MQMVTMTSYHDIVILYNSVKALAQGHNLLYLGKIGIYTTHKVQDMDETCAQIVKFVGNSIGKIYFDFD